MIVIIYFIIIIKWGQKDIRDSWKMLRLVESVGLCENVL